MGNGSDKSGWRGRLAALVLSFFGAAPLAAQEACRDQTVHLRGEWGLARFNVEIADDFEERRVGLMNRPSLPVSSGMLFIYEYPQALSFWMRNTLIPLDMIFIDARGVVQHIHHEAVPLDETGIFGGTDLTTVLEINGGLARQLGITEGSEVRHPSFDPSDAVWPC
ncbi:DUF192 domain-containing protein [Sulfitobacter aestuariivivens]|uniref:DUF192 domain-containing protein n=1 Tax=Sulfitobacter aestuariivivens TaxID=2766981 RepID=A0A927D355_9RHOB|nr:DUF192 domain-containing protein [Sulfitobacter aestuariivivens]MBD3663463.1 DUF192 domain-containing protein [Sulfitobacter aestuariivivens]